MKRMSIFLLGVMMFGCVSLTACADTQKAADTAVETTDSDATVSSEDTDAESDEAKASESEKTESDEAKASEEENAETDEAKASEDAESASTVQIEVGETEQKELWTQTEIYPNNIDDTFVIDVCLPDDYDENISYPVVYLTDCYWRREDYASIKELYESGTAREFILVGIGYPDDYDFDTVRMRDLVDDPHSFLDLIVNGIMPYVESNYNIDATDRTFCGASCGAYFMVYSMFQSDGMTKDLFKNYVLASPTFYYETNGRSLTDEMKDYAERTNELKENIYLTVGGEEPVPDMQRPVGRFVSRMEKYNFEGMNLTFETYDGLDHYQVWVPSLLKGLSMFLAK